MKKVLSIAGSDCSGGAGIQADLKTFSAHGVYGMSVIVSVVAENTGRVIGIEDVSPDMVGKQIDPVMYAKNGCPLMEPAAVKTLIETVIPLADVLTPNIPETERITGSRIGSAADMEEAAKAIHTKNTHGTGCTFSSAVASQLARGLNIREAVQKAKDYVTMAIVGGCTVVQLREKDIPSLDFYLLASEIKKITDRYDIPLIINDRIDIAMAVGAAGVHIGQNDIPADIARKIIGKDMLLGVSVGVEAEAVHAVKAGTDYLGVGAMFPTKTKPDALAVSMEELKRIRKAVDIPIVVIGGINRENAMLFHPMGIDGLAVVSAVIAGPDIKRSAAALRELFFGKENCH